MLIRRLGTLKFGCAMCCGHCCTPNGERAATRLQRHGNALFTKVPLSADPTLVRFPGPLGLDAYHSIPEQMLNGMSLRDLDRP